MDRVCFFFFLKFTISVLILHKGGQSNRLCLTGMVVKPEEFPIRVSMDLAAQRVTSPNAVLGVSDK